jgi:spore coat polysaccharide biosynthesis protein SpsF (cytidylyltransferase family)
MTDHTVAIIQARMGSSRLPEKVLKEIGDHPLLWHVVTRTSLASSLDETVVATTIEPQDDRIADFCERHGFEYTRGSEEDVLDRYYESAKTQEADTVVRVTGDCPLIAPEVIDQVVRIYRESDAEYVNNKLEYPNGLDVEAMAFETLECAWEEAETSDKREHVTPYIRTSADFEKRKAENPLDIDSYSATDEETVLRWSVDYPSDLAFVREIYNRLSTHSEWTINQQAVFELFERNPEIVDMTEHASPADFEYE